MWIWVSKSPITAMPSSSPGLPRWDLWDSAVMGSHLYILMCDRDEQQRVTATNVQEPLSTVGAVLRALLLVLLLNSQQHFEESQGTDRDIGQIAQDPVCLRDRNLSHVVQIQSRCFRHFLPLCI